MASQNDPTTDTTNTSYSTSNPGANGPVLSGSDTDTGSQIKQAASQAQDKVSQATQQVTQQAKSGITGQISNASQTLNGVASALNQVGDQLRKNDQTSSFANYADQAATQVNRFAGYLQNKNADQLLNDVQDLARRQPVWFLAGAFGIGIVASRFLKSSQPSGGSNYGGQWNSGQNRSMSGNRYAMGGQYGGNYGQNYRGSNSSGSSNMGANYGGPGTNNVPDYHLYQGQGTNPSGMNTGSTTYGTTSTYSTGTSGSNQPYDATSQSSYTDVANGEEDRLRNSETTKR